MEKEVIEGIIRLEYLNGVYDERRRILDYVNSDNEVELKDLIAFISEGKNE